MAWRAAAASLAAAILGSALGGCSTVSDLYGSIMSSAPAVKPSPLPEFKPTATLQQIWKAGTGSAGAFVFSPATDGRLVFVASRDGRLSAFDLESGSQVWAVDLDRKLSAGVGEGGGLLVVGTEKGDVLAYDKSGKPVWRSRVSSEILAAPVVADSVVVVRTSDGRMFGLDLAEGKRKWSYQRATPALTVRNPAGVLATPGMVFAGFAGGRLVALAAASGTVAWETAVAVPRGTTELERIADVTSTPVADERQVCAVAYQGRLACFDLQNGGPQWAKDISSVAGIAADRLALYVADDRSALVAFDRQRGTGLWKQEKLSGRRLSTPAVVGKYVLAGDYQGYVHLVAADDGSFAARAATDGSRILAQPLRVEGSVIVQTADGGLYRFAVK